MLHPRQSAAKEKGGGGGDGRGSGGGGGDGSQTPDLISFPEREEHTQTYTTKRTPPMTPRQAARIEFYDNRFNSDGGSSSFLACEGLNHSPSHTPAPLFRPGLVLSLIHI